MRLGAFVTCHNEFDAINFSLSELRKIYPEIPIFLVSDGQYDFSYLYDTYTNISILAEEDTISSTFNITDTNFREEIHQKNIKKAALATIDRLSRAIEFCQTEYIIMLDPDTLVRGPLTIPDCALLGSRINKGLPEGIARVLAEVPGSIPLDTWGATPAIFDAKKFQEAAKVLEYSNTLDKFIYEFYAIYAHDVFLPILFALIGEEETFNPDIIECKRDPEWERKSNPLVHQFKRYY